MTTCSRELLSAIQSYCSETSKPPGHHCSSNGILLTLALGVVYLDLQSGTFAGSGAGLPTPAFFWIWSGSFSKSLEMWILKALHSLWLAFL